MTPDPKQPVRDMAVKVAHEVLDHMRTHDSDPVVILGFDEQPDGTFTMRVRRHVEPCAEHDGTRECEIANLMAFAHDFVHDYGVSAAAMMTNPDVVRSYVQRHGTHQGCHS